MRNQKLGVAVVGTLFALAIAAIVWLTNGVIGMVSTPGLGNFVAPVNAVARTLGEIGPGACWPADERPSGGTAAGFAHENGAKEASNWFRTPDGKAAAEREDRWYSARKDYYLVYEVVPEWDQLDPVERVARYTAKLSVVKMKTPIRIYNTHCKNGEVEAWEEQVLPTGEWLGFIPGHEPGKADPRPAKKMVCGNDLFAPPPPAPEQPGTTTVPPGTPGCEQSGCTVTTTQPPSCTYKCGNETKKAEQGSDPKGNAPVGGGVKDQPGPDVLQPHTPNPETPRTNPVVPTQATPPPGSTPTQIQPPPVETSVNAPSSAPNEGDPGGF